VTAHAVFVDPEIAAVGMTEQQARGAGHDVAIGTQEFTGVAKVRAIGETAGFIKFVVDATTDRILGCHIVGPDAGNLASVAASTPAVRVEPERTIDPTIRTSRRAGGSATRARNGP
jgi:pyruvate/2-oxoglutarate dehydrogenase complex dihydrolipoamide dehydrogenase (E3) component